MDKGLHPLQIADGFEKGCEIAVKKLEEISSELDIEIDEHEMLI